MKTNQYILSAFLTIFICNSAGFTENNSEKKEALLRNGNLIEEPVFKGRVYLYESGREFETSVVLVHGVGDDASKIWDNLIPILEKKYHVIAFDLPGFGNSSKKNMLYSPENYARFIKWLVDSYVKGPMYLVGHSMGGAISLYYAGTYPERLRRLVLVDAAGILHRASFSKNMANLKLKDGGLTEINKKPLDTLNYFINTSIENIDDKLMPEDLSGILKSSFFRDKVLGADPGKNSGIALIQTNFSKQIENVNVPAFIIWGENDPIAPLRIGKMLAANIQGARLKIMRDIGHNPMVESPDQFIELLLECLMAEPAPVQQGTSAPPVKGIGSVDVQSNITFTGHYDRIEIKNSDNIRLKDVTARYINIENSKVEIENCRIESDDVGIRIFDSIVIVTGSTIDASVAISTSNSKIDLAGVKLKGGKYAIQSSYISTVVFSVCNVKSPFNNRHVHEIIKIDESNPL